MDNYSSLKLKLASYGAIRPQVWSKILYHLQTLSLKPNESFTRQIGTIVYVVKGLLKEYDVRSRKKPAVINFIPAEGFLITTKYHQFNYIKAIENSELVYLDFEILFSLYVKYPELRTVYDAIVADYESSFWLRSLLLEEKVASLRIKQFIRLHRSILPCLKKKDIANYIHIEYDYFIRMYGKLL